MFVILTCAALVALGFLDVLREGGRPRVEVEGEPELVERLLVLAAGEQEPTVVGVGLGGAQPRAVDIVANYAGDQFEVSRSDDTYTVTADDVAVTGTVDTVTVSLSSDPDTPAVSLALQVGPAPSELPKGGSVVQTCTQASGSSCTFNVIGAKGEVNPLPRTPLTIENVQGSSECPSVKFTASSATG